MHWFIYKDLKKSAEEHYRTRFAVSLKDKDPPTIIRHITFDGVAPEVTIRDIDNLFNFVEKRILKRKIKGTGLEVGAGPATFSSVLAKKDSVEKMYAVEVCRPIVELLIPKVAEYVLGGKSDKVAGVVGSFDNMELPDGSVDFVFDFFSLHHSDNLETTLKECRRVLKKDGFIFCFDKARPDYFIREDLDELLDAEYDENFKKKMGMPLNQKFTRRMNDEKEYRLKDWFSAFQNSGFAQKDYFYLAKTESRNPVFGKVKSFLSALPAPVQLFLNRFLPSPKFNHKFILASQNRIFAKEINSFPKEISFLTACK
ncbi:MAG: class I SAM-dependent methyltransferase [Patescibacteria group bacterium]